MIGDNSSDVNLLMRHNSNILYDVLKRAEVTIQENNNGTRQVCREVSPTENSPVV